ncbi:sugar ABC transporter substrate-binding protein [Clostridium intestinale]|uniref:D-xylose transport system substrate-binding protein n=1 Tax=Clostridium intestinale DSM 6191 TaxID=1121320 RepID=A0A1M5YV45_9CLOT|nr:substrate-binding domain-containing protein [Clostridium intestinale]SHI15947.1 D-xylose transport system substrate-binding protein [Clostridium intestinale DSM 6191]
MYLSKPEVFSVPIRYINFDILGLEKNDIKRARHHVFIGVILPNQRESRWVRDKEAMEREARLREVNIKIEYNDFNIEKQRIAVEKLMSEGVNALIITSIDHGDEASLVNKAKESGIKVISYDLLIKNSEVDVYISFNIVRVGEFQGRYLTKNVPKGNYILLSGEPSEGLLREGAMTYIQPLIFMREIRVVTDQVVKGWDPDNAFKIVEEALVKSGNRVDAILSPNDAIAGASIKALENQGLAGKVAVTGQDADLAAIQRIIQGTQSMTVLKDSRELGKVAIETAIKLVEGKYIDYNAIKNNGKKDVPSILIEPIAIDKSNLYTTFKETEYYKDGF